VGRKDGRKGKGSEGKVQERERTWKGSERRKEVSELTKVRAWRGKE
jgi:hypothetical protein